ncbi:hypothetical protein M5K25_007770 [Dendrobium thyrsiflorum]|uniref:Uncharacterized protein n=1 Tax=Dendrobium thyrsiflorum TaxID=117978 RepID=A0ABD0VFK7_DENTH
MTTKKVDALKGKVEKIKSRMGEKFSTIDGRFSAMENQMKSRFGGLEKMMRKLMEMQSKTPLAVSIVNLNQDLTEIPLAKSKGNEIGQKELDEESFFYQEPPPRAPTRDGSGFPDGGTVRREFYGGGSGVSDHYRRHFGKGEWATGDGGGQAEPRGSAQARRVEERLDFHPRYMRKTLRDHNNRYTEGGRNY